MTTNVRAQGVRELVGAPVTVQTDRGPLHGTLLSCTTRSLWLVDDAELDVVVGLDHVTAVVADAA